MDHFISARSAACVTTGGAPARLTTSPTALVIIVIAVYTLLTMLGVGQTETLAGLGGAAALGLKVAARLGTTSAAADA